MTAAPAVGVVQPDRLDRLSRLKVFLCGAEAIEIVAPHESITGAPNYLTRFLQRIAIPAAVGAALAAGLPAASAEQSPAGHQVQSEAKSILSGVRNISARYLAHGRTPGKVTVQAVSPNVLPQRGPSATFTETQCTIQGIRLDYSKADKMLARMTTTPELRAFVLIHEHTHCRTGPSLLGQFKSPEIKSLADNFKEASSDAMAILMIARRDGVPTALATLQTVEVVRMIEAADDPIHDTRETLKSIRLVLHNHPERFASDASAFETALVESVRGAAKFHDQQRRQGLAAPMSKEEAARFAAALQHVAEDYLSGKVDGTAADLRANGFRSPPTPAQPPAWVKTAASLDPERVKTAVESALAGIAPRDARAAVLAQVDSPATRIRALYQTQRFRALTAVEEEHAESYDAPRQ